MEIVANMLCEIDGAATGPDQAHDGPDKCGLDPVGFDNRHGDADISRVARGWRIGKRRAETGLDPNSHG